MHISVIITTHAALDHHLARCIDSVRWQLQPGDELIIVADGYEPKESVAEAYGRADCYWLSKRGVSAARNYGAAAAKNEWLKFLDVDDLLAPFALNTLRSVDGKIPDNVAVVAGQMVKVQDGLAVALHEAPDAEAIITRVNPLVVSQAFVRKSVFSRFGVAGVHGLGFDERIEFEEDWEFWLRLRSVGLRFAALNLPVCYYCIDAAERAAKVRNHTVEGKDIRAYLQEKYKL